MSTPQHQQGLAEREATQAMMTHAFQLGALNMELIPHDNLLEFLQLSFKISLKAYAGSRSLPRKAQPFLCISQPMLSNLASIKVMILVYILMVLLLSKGPQMKGAYLLSSAPHLQLNEGEVQRDNEDKDDEPSGVRPSPHALLVGDGRLVGRQKGASLYQGISCTEPHGSMSSATQRGTAVKCSPIIHAWNLQAPFSLAVSQRAHLPCCTGCHICMQTQLRMRMQ